MATQPYFLVFKDSTQGGLPKTGLAPVFTLFKNAVTLADIAPAPTITPVGLGIYTFSYDPVVGAIYQVDGGAALTNLYDRYQENVCALDPATAVLAAVQIGSYAAGQDPGALLDVHPLQTNPAHDTVAEAWQSARALLLGNKTSFPSAVPPTMVVYAHDGTTAFAEITYGPTFFAPTSTTAARS